MCGMSSMAGLRLAAIMLVGFHAHAELTPPVEVSNSTAVAINRPHQERPETLNLVASSPSWCQFVPHAFHIVACGSPGSASAPSPAPAPALNAPSTAAQCQQLSAEQRARSAACTYSEKEAMQFAALSAAAYCSPEEWTCGEACRAVPDMRSVRRIDNDELDAHAYVGRLGEACVVAFRGTDNVNGWGQDLASVFLTELPGCSHQGETCRVGAGFLQNYQAIAEAVRAQLSAIGCVKSTPMFVTGHSLGGALATLAMFDLERLGYNLAKAYTFGQPRVGDAAFASAFNRAMVWTPVFRVTKRDDPFVYLPSRDPFHHVGTEVYYRGDTTEGYRICDGSGEDATCQDSEGNGDVASLLLKCVIPQECGHLNYLQPLMRYPLGHASCTSSWTGILFP
mmetsp:Transcript_134005/g.347084  ORF Transcript_134005/g.347084 Transcript_134005/m.347084 type:complete len:395 (-) Transcript_134005:40-1224(-)